MIATYTKNYGQISNVTSKWICRKDIEFGVPADGRWFIHCVVSSSPRSSMNATTYHDIIMIDNCGNKYIRRGSHYNSGWGDQINVAGEYVNIKYKIPMSDYMIDYIKNILVDPPVTQPDPGVKAYWIRPWRELDFDIIVEMWQKMNELSEQNRVEINSLAKKNCDKDIQIHSLTNDISMKDKYIKDLLQKIADQDCKKRHCMIQ
jgi:hypothetical protein